ncbi:MAG TPA: DUF2164 family protein [Candidatus Nitrosotenuis sp.]|nr:DUF2164 family protein [Candidatus Nitrosotenuis sp.]
MLKKFDNISNEVKQKCIAEVIARVEEIESTEVGIIAAQDIIDIVTHNLGPEIYNMAVKDTKKLLQERFSDLEYEIDSLEQSS